MHVFDETRKEVLTIVRQYKPTFKATSAVVAVCRLSDCVYYEGAVDAETCTCSHPDKSLHRSGPRCPLYRFDWAKKMAQASRR